MSSNNSPNLPQNNQNMANTPSNSSILPSNNPNIATTPNPSPTKSSVVASSSSTTSTQNVSPKNAIQLVVSQFKVSLPKLKVIVEKVVWKLMIWLIFTVIVGLLPLFISGLLGHFDHKLRETTDLFIHGELLIISFSLAADAIGDLVSNWKHKIVWGFFLGACFILFGLTAGVFVGLGFIDVSADKQEIGNFSLYTLAATFLASAGSKVLSEV